MIIVLDGNKLKLEDISALVRDPGIRIEIAPEALAQIQKSHQTLIRDLGGNIVYGVNTGFGPMASHVLGKSQLAELQKNLIVSHAVGMGRAINPDIVLAAMTVRLNSLVKGYSSVSEELISWLKFFINERILPIVPEHGAVGTSGDLVQLSHIALAIIGEGEVIYKNQRRQTKQVLQELDAKPYVLKPKEGLALINGTSTMTAIASLLYFDATKLLSLAVRSGVLAVELVRGFTDTFAPLLHELRPHPGQKKIAELCRNLLADSKLVRNREDFQSKIKPNGGDVEKIPHTVQEIYSLRCIPQILGPAFDSIVSFKKIISTEINSVTDNPILDPEKNIFLHGGNFHGDYIASGIDQVKIPLVKMSLLSERRISFFLNANQNQLFPPFLNLKKPGLTLALQGLQFVATSTAAQNQSLAYPHSLHTISTNADNQDVVSMGTDAGLLARKVIDNAYIISTIEIITLCQAVDVLGVQGELSAASKQLYDHIRKIFPKIVDDRIIINELEQCTQFLKTNDTLNLDWR